MVVETKNSAVITCINPATREAIAEVPVTALDEIPEIVQRAGKAFQSWKNVPLEQRLARIENFRKLLFNAKEELSAVITSETGKPRVESLVAEIFGVLETCKWLQQNAPRLLRPQMVRLNPVFFPGRDSYNVFEPLGVVAVISPWNYPFSIPLATIVTALAAGNAVVFKPSPKTAFIAQTAVKMLYDAGFPTDLIGLVQGDKDEAEKLIYSDVNRIMFTGSTGGGKAIMAMAAKKLLPVTLELGGKHPAIVLKDSNVDAIAPAIVWAAFTNAGQACASIERLYVERPIAEKLTAKVADLTLKLRLGNGISGETDVGPLIDESLLERVDQQVQQSISQGAKLLSGGKRRSDLGGYFYEPTVLSNVSESMPVVAEEIFGPVLPIIVVDSPEEAVRLANNSSLGLGSSIWTRDLALGEKLARELEAGMVWINDGLYSHVCPDAPWGGIKESGFGRMHSAVELLDLVYIKNVGVSSQGNRDWHYPYSDSGFNYVRSGVQLLHATSIVEKIAAVLNLVKTKVFGATTQSGSKGKEGND